MLDAEVAVAVAAWLASASTTIDDGVVVRSYSEAGFRCILAREKQALGRYLKEGDSLVGVNGLHVEDDTAVTHCSPLTLLLATHSLRSGSTAVMADTALLLHYHTQRNILASNYRSRSLHEQTRTSGLPA